MVWPNKRFGTIKFFEIFFCIFWILPSKNDLPWKKSFLDFANDPPFEGGKRKVFTKKRQWIPYKLIYVCTFNNSIGLHFHFSWLFPWNHNITPLKPLFIYFWKIIKHFTRCFEITNWFIYLEFLEEITNGRFSNGF